MGQRTRSLTQVDFSGGANAVVSPYLVPSKQVVIAHNMQLCSHGSLRTRDGYRVDAVSPNTVDPIVYRGILQKSDGSTTPFAIQKTTAGNVLYNTGTTPWTVVGTMPMAYDTPDVAYMGNAAFIANGYETPWVWDGSTLSRVVVNDPATQVAPYGAKHVAAHLGALWIWNTAPTSSALDGPSSLRATLGNLIPVGESGTAQPFNVYDWDDGYQVHVSRDDNQVGMGMSTFTIAETGISPTATMVLFKNFSAYQVTGFFGSPSFSIQRVKTDMGCVAPRTIQFVSGYGIIRLTHRGFALYNGVDDKLISEEIRPYLFGCTGTDPVQTINWAAADRAWAGQSQTPPLYVCACPVSGNALTRVFLFDLVRRAWTIAEYAAPLSTLAFYPGTFHHPLLQAGTYTGGQILTIFDGAADDGGTPIRWHVRTRDYFLGSPLRPTYWRRLVLDMDFEPTQTVASVVSVFGGETRATTMTFTGTATGATYGSAIYGTDLYGASSTDRAQRSIDVQRTYPSVRVDLTGTGSVVLRGLEWHAVPKPLTRMAR